eukprot:GHVN01031085.1.p1 GENE.GHVN01031085.1~~GHVN01031085.1.p1  ORF type:complete len:110 (+),score=6.72 GHVN01031085.1:160-489(+)
MARTTLFSISFLVLAPRCPPRDGCVFDFMARNNRSRINMSQFMRFLVAPGVLAPRCPVSNEIVGCMMVECVRDGVATETSKAGDQRRVCISGGKAFQIFPTVGKEKSEN